MKRGGRLRSCRSSLGFAITNYNGSYEIWLIHDITERNVKSIAELAAFMDGARSLGIDVTVCAFG